MDLQDDSALETMAQPASSSSVSTTAPVLPPPVAVSPTPPRTTLQKGFPKQIAQNAVEDKFLCEHCNLILRHPVQSRCGHRFCRSCRDELLSQQQPIKCHACLEEGASEEESVLDLESMFDDKAAIREMKKIPVKCINPGCPWKGSFQEYSSSHEFGCDKKLVDCSLCGVPVSQARITHHETKQCPKRSITCQHCKETMLAEQQDKHLQATCPNLPIRCDRCSKQVLRSELKIHKDEECPHRIVECPVPDCNTKLPLDQFANHFMKTQQSTQKHMLYLFSKIQQLERTITEMESEAATVGGASGGTTQSAGLSHQGGTSGGRDDVAASAEINALATEDKQKLKLHEDLMAVLHGEILRCIKHVESLDARLQKENGYVKDVQKKLDILEKSMGILDNKLQDIISKQIVPDPTEYGVLKELSEGTALWRIDQFVQVRRAACNGHQPFINSPAFSTGPCGYKLRIRFFADGDGSAKGKAFSAFVQIQKGPYDDLLPWPFTGKIYFILVDIKDFKEHKAVSFSALPDQPAFEKPQPQGDNSSSGCLEFVSLREFSECLDKYLVNDTIFIKVYVSLPDRVLHRLQSLDPKNMIRR